MRVDSQSKMVAVVAWLKNDRVYRIGYYKHLSMESAVFSLSI
jgi:hypothetical protein